MPETDQPDRWSEIFQRLWPREQHKGSMASVAFHLNNQVLKGENVKLFEGCDGFRMAAKRVISSTSKMSPKGAVVYEPPGKSGIFNCGTGRAEPFQNVAEAVSKHHGKGEIEYIPFPDHLKGRYQSFTSSRSSPNCARPAVT